MKTEIVCSAKNHETITLVTEDLGYTARESELRFQSDALKIVGFLNHFIPSGTFDRVLEKVLCDEFEHYLEINDFEASGKILDVLEIIRKRIEIP